MGNCADVRILPSGSSPVPSVAPVTTTTVHPSTTATVHSSTTTLQSSATTTRELRATSTAEFPMTTPTTSAGPMVCKGNAARWTTDEQCSVCATGYQWWPCNEADLCFCSGSLSQLSASEPKRREVRAHGFLSRQHALMQTGRIMLDKTMHG